MKTSNAVIKWFMEKKKDVYPYSDVPKTRQGYYPKWLLTMSRNREGQQWRIIGYYVIKASCLNWENLQNLIMDGDGIPLPADFAEVVDALETWGGTEYSCWLQKVLRLMHEYFREDNMYGGVPPTKMRLFHDCILIGVQRKAELNFIRNTADYNMVLENWNTYFWVRSREEYAFFILAFDSINCAEEMIESIHARNHVAMYGNPAQNTTVSAPNVIPESPASRSAPSTRAGENTYE
jgi:hypothetical protein